MNEAELLAYRLCRKSFLSLWSYMNPRQKPSGKELCDVIVVCQPDILIVSVKHASLPKNGTAETNVARWKRRAIDASVAQRYGAERILKKLTHIVRNDSSLGVALPTLGEPRVLWRSSRPWAAPSCLTGRGHPTDDCTKSATASTFCLPMARG
jgi:hypothetical protein